MIGEAWLFALGLCGTLLFLASVLHIPINALTAVACALTALAAGCWEALKGRGPRAEGRESSSASLGTRHSALGILLTAIPIAVVLYAALFIPLRDFDGRAFWLLKAKGIAQDHAIDGPFFHQQQVVDPRNDYPLLMPLDSAVVFLLGRTYDDTAVRWLHVITFIAFVLFIRERLGPWPAAILAWIPQFSVAGEGGALSAYNDIPLAAFVAAAFFELIDGKRPLRFGMWLAFAALTKNEGLALAIILLAAGVYVFRRRILPALTPLGVVVIALAVWKHRIPHGGEEDLAALLPTLPQQLHRLPGAVMGFTRHLIAPPWGLFWIAVLIALAWQAWKEKVVLPAYVIAAAFALYIAVYSVTTWVQLDLINSSADRLLMHVVGPALFALSELVRSR
jgi:hypothetical protein